MALLARALYDPAGAVTKNTTAALAMTALDTTNLRLTVTTPASGFMLVRLKGVIHGATTFPSVLLGILEGASVIARVAPAQVLGNTAVATALVSIEAVFTIAASAGSHVYDAAYAVETLVAATGIKYGGANDTTANNAFGGFLFEIWSA